MLVINKLSMRNFFSFGNYPQVVDLNTNDIALILGQNNDAKSDENGDMTRNGVGKSAIIQGLVFGLYGKSIGNEIKIPNLINKLNPKYCEVQIEFSKDGVDYRVERGRNPAYFRFIKVKEEGDENDSRGESKDTQEDLEQTLGISQLLFEYVVVMNGSVDPFLATGSAKQREIIEELLGITELTEKALALKEKQKITSTDATQEKFIMDTLQSTNENILRSIEQLQEKAVLFESKKLETINLLRGQISEYDGIDFNGLIDLANKADAAITNNNKRKNFEEVLERTVKKFEQAEKQAKEEKEQLAAQISKLEQLDISEELRLHDEKQRMQAISQLQREQSLKRAQLEMQLKTNGANLTRLTANLESEEKKLSTVESNKCPLCNNNIQDDCGSIKELIISSIDSLKDQIQTLKNTISTVELEYNEFISSMNTETIVQISTFYNTVADAQMHQHKLNELKNKFSTEQLNVYSMELVEAYANVENTPLQEYESTLSLVEVNALQNHLQSLKRDLEREISAINPYNEQIETLKTDSLKEVSYDRYNELKRLAEHQDFLAKLLLNKDSFIRKTLIEQNITYLNSRLKHYISEIESQHEVEFLNDLSVGIELNGNSYDFKQLSRGERTRITIALNLAFRDVFEFMRFPINIVINDELIDNGLDPHGVEVAWNIFSNLCTDGSKSVFIISHREEIRNRAQNILLITKEDSFSTIDVISEN